MEHGAGIRDSALLLAPRSSLTMHIGFTYDLRTDYLAAGYGEEETAEFDQVGTIDAIDDALQELGHDVDRIGHARSLVERLARGDRWDLVFNICEGLRGRGARSAGAGDSRRVRNPVHVCRPGGAGRVPRQSADENGAASGRRADARLARRARLGRSSIGADLPFPVIAKPLAEGTGKGIDAASKIDDRRALRQTCERLLDAVSASRCSSSSFLPGREFTVGILGTGDDAEVRRHAGNPARARAPSRMCIRTSTRSNARRLVDFPLVRASDDPAVAEAERIALAAWRAVGGRDARATRPALRCRRQAAAHGNQSAGRPAPDAFRPADDLDRIGRGICRID